MFKNIVFISLIFMALTGCKTSESNTQPSENPTPETEQPENTIPPAITNARSFIFGHSLLVHENTPSPSEEKKVPHWIHALAQEAGLQFAADGQYGFLRNHADFSGINAQWGFQNVPSTWTDENMDFTDVDFNIAISTPGNFIQYQAPDALYYDSTTESPLSATLDILDQTRTAHPSIPFYIYENWPDMSGYGTFPGSINFTQYNNDTISGDFHNWFITYHDAILAARPGSNVKMIPTGPILSKLFRDTVLSGLALTDLYEDDAPHGEATLYFLASMVTYMAIYQTQAPVTFTPPATVNILVRSNYTLINNFIWAELNAFNFPDGNSRVF